MYYFIEKSFVTLLAFALLVMGGSASFAQETRVCVKNGSAIGPSREDTAGHATDNAMRYGCCQGGFETVVNIDPMNATCQFLGYGQGYSCSSAAKFTCQKKPTR